MKKPVLRVALAASVLALGTLTACGGDKTEAYCDDLKSAEKDLKNIGQDPDDINKAVDTFKQIASDAPEEVKSDWKILIDGMEVMADAFSDMGSTDASADPEAAMKALEKAQEKMKDLDQDKLKKAGEEIDAHAKKACDIDLGSLGD